MPRSLFFLSLATVLILSSCRFFAPPVPAPAPPEPGFTRIAEEDLPPALRGWADNSRTMQIAHSKVYQNKRYILASYGEKPSGGYSIAIEDVVIGDDNIIVTVNYTDPAPGSNVTDALTYPMDFVYIGNLDLPIEYKGTGEEYVPTLVGIEELPEIVAQSKFIKIFDPAPDTRIPPSFTVEGVANVFEGAISCRLRDAQGNFSQEIQATAGMGDWYFFQVDMEVPEEFEDSFHLELFTYSAKDGSIENLVQIPLKREEAGD